ncbi:MAG: hypothetical protein JXR96_25695 [Deltaproteobacteria bacterium]|nr:hypothetical protein [Deltaproteobacteria bacterium]
MSHTQANELVAMLQRGEITLRELKGITEEEMAAGVAAGREIMARGAHQAAAEVLSCLALYDPYRPDVWQALAELMQRERSPDQARLFAGLARAMA